MKRSLQLQRFSVECSTTLSERSAIQLVLTGLVLIGLVLIRVLTLLIR